MESQGQGFSAFITARSLVTRSFPASQPGCSLPLCQAKWVVLFCLFFFFLPRLVISWRFEAISITMKTLLCKMSICLFKGIFHRSDLNRSVKCQERMFNEDQLEALIGWVFNGFPFFFWWLFYPWDAVFTEILIKF